MPYPMGQRQETTSSKVADWSHVKRLPGVLVPVQLGCSFMGFLLGVGGSMVWRVGHAHGVFIFFSFLSCISCVCYLALRVMKLHQVVCRRADMNWNIVGLVHSGVSCLLMMVGSCIMVDFASGARVLRAAGVFGFLGFTVFLVQLAWEVLAWRKTKGGGGGGLLPGYATASVVHGPDRPVSLDSQCSSRGEVVLGAVALGEGEREEETVGFVGMKKRPVSSFLQPSSHGEVTTPMLYAPGFDEEGETETKRDPEIDEKEGGEEAEEVGEEAKEVGEKAKKRGVAEDKVKKGKEEEDSDDNMVSARMSSASSTSSTTSCQGGDWRVPS